MNAEEQVEARAGWRGWVAGLMMLGFFVVSLGLALVFAGAMRHAGRGWIVSVLFGAAGGVCVTYTALLLAMWACVLASAIFRRLFGPR